MTKEFNSFTLVEQKPLPDIRCDYYLYKHDKTGAQVMYLKTDDDNKAFSIAFRTPPYDDNGIAHIIEHSVLNGSKKYPTKEPFVELLKGSLQTFLNAWTFSDKTMYPVASRNQKDFENLMDVYLDAVFYPNLLSNPQILMQEGWHYHLENKEDELTYKGVVYNEMKGAFSQPESELNRLVEPTLFPDTFYKHISGGMPASIPTLTQEKFIDFHQTYYHPSNARVTLYGNLDLAKAMEQLSEYFDAFEAKEVPFVGYQQEPFTSVKELTSTYSVSKGDSTENKTLLEYAWATGTSTNGEEGIALSILDELLLGSNTAPLKKALLKANIGSDVMGGYSAYTYSPTFEVILKDTDADKKEQFVQIIQQELQRLVKEGISRKAIQAALNKTAFRYKELTALEGSTPKGVMYGMNALTSWLYDGSPYVSFEYQQHLDAIQAKVEEGYFENIIQKYLLDNTHAAVITLKPEPGLLEEKEAELAKKLAEYKASLSEEELDQLVETTQKLIERQESPDRPEDLAKIPTLSIDDIQKKATQYPLTVEEGNDTPTFLHYEDFTAGISYAKYFFDMRGIKTEEIPVAAFVTELLGEISTKHFADEDLNTEMDFYTGGISTNAFIMTEDVAKNVYYPFFTVSGKALSQYLPKLIELVEEIVFRSNLEDYDKIKELLLNTKANLEMHMNYASHTIAVRRLESYYSEGSKYAQALEGIDYYDYISDLVKHYDERKESFSQQLIAVLRQILNIHGVTATFVGSKEDFEQFKTLSQSFFQHLSQEVVTPQPFTTPVEVLNEGFKTAQEIQYVAKGYNQTLIGVPFEGSNAFLQTILGLDYLWNTVRVKGGAYGGMSVIGGKGEVAAVSYRDPNLVETLKTYDGQVQYLENYNPSKEEFEKNLIGTFSSIDRPLSANQKGNIAFTRYFTHVTNELVQKTRDEVLNVTPEKVRSFAPTMKKVLDQNAFVVVGNDVKIEQNKEIFKTIRSLFND